MSPPALLESTSNGGGGGGGGGCGGQFSSISSSSSFNSSSGNCLFRDNMNSSSSNSNHVFPNMNETNPVLGFNSPPVASRKPAAAAGSSASNLSRPRPRLVKMRKHTSSNNPGSTPAPAPGSFGSASGANLGPGFTPFQGSSESGSSSLGSLNPAPAPAPAPGSFGAASGANLGPGFTPFQGSSESGSSSLGSLNPGNVAKETFLFGATRSNPSLNKDTGSGRGNSGGILDEMRKLKIDGDKDSMGGGNAALNFKLYGSENKKNANDETMVNELPKEISKLRIGGSGNVVSMKNFGHVGHGDTNQFAGKFANYLYSSVAVELQNDMKNMNIKDPRDVARGSDSTRSFVFGKNTKASDGLTGRSETILPGERRDEPKANPDIISDRVRELKLCPPDGAIGSSIAFDDINSGKNLGSTDTEGYDTASSSRSSSFSSSSFQFFGNASSMSRPEQKVEFSFTTKSDNPGAPHMEFKTPNLKASPFSGMNSIFEAKKEPVKDTRSKKKKKLRKPINSQIRPKQEFVFSGRSSSENSDTFEAYSPMDVSPYHETLADNYSRETSVTSEEAFQMNDRNVSSESLPTVTNVTTDDSLLAATHRLNLSDSDVKSSLARDGILETYINEVSETESFKSATENLEYSSDTFVTALDSELNSTATSGRQGGTEAPLFNFASKLDKNSKDCFTFAASSSSQGQLSPDTRLHKKKHRHKIVQDSYTTSDAKNPYAPSSSSEFFPSGSPSLLSPQHAQKSDMSNLPLKKDNSKIVHEQDSKQETVAPSSVSFAAQETCEKWRLRGNQAYSSGDLSKAEDYYTQGLNSVPQSEKSRSCLRALMLCYSNRAATRVALGRMRDALKDCLMAAAIDPNFLKVQVRAANCYLAIGEVENASVQFMKCLQAGSDVCADRKLLIEASEGLEKAHKVSECIKQYNDHLQSGLPDDLLCALKIIDQALQMSSYSEKFLQMKADVLLMLRRYEQVIQVCEQNACSADMEAPVSSSSRVWRICLIVRSYFYLGKLEEALEFIKKQEMEHTTERAGSVSLESVIPLAETVRELLSRKAAGNEAYKSGKHAEAVEHYTAALSCSVESRPFAAICFCNRAAAYRALGQITDAIADCSLAIALDPNYLKAISRRASMYEMIRDYGQAAIDLQRLVSLLSKQVDEKSNASGASDRLSCINDLRQTQLRLSNVEEESRKEIPLNMYLILGVESTASASEVKKAYRKAALKHHPDKAAQSLSRTENGDDGLWKEIAENVHKDADRLFKMIGEAYAVLSDPSKRSKYDLEEEMRNEPTRFSRSSSSRMAADAQTSAFERSGSRRQWQDSSWRPYARTTSKGPERTAQAYRYTRYP